LPVCRVQKPGIETRRRRRSSTLSRSESRVTAEFYNCAVEVMRGAETIDEYVALPQQEAFDIEYWLLEEAKLRAELNAERAAQSGSQEAKAP